MAKMSEETKSKLREINQKRRGVLAKDFPALDYQIACDKLKEQGWDLERDEVILDEPDPLDIYGEEVAYLRWVPKEVKEALSKVIPSKTYKRINPRTREEYKVIVFREKTIIAVLRLLDLDWRKYTTVFVP